MGYMRFILLFNVDRSSSAGAVVRAKDYTSFSFSLCIYFCI